MAVVIVWLVVIVRVVVIVCMTVRVVMSGLVVVESLALGGVHGRLGGSFSIEALLGPLGRADPEETAEAVLASGLAATVGARGDVGDGRWRKDLVGRSARVTPIVDEWHVTSVSRPRGAQVSQVDTRY